MLTLFWVAPEPPRPSFVNRPFHRDADFIERAALAEIISRTRCSNPISRIALVGQGGVGYDYQPKTPPHSLLTHKDRKSQVAIEYAYRTREAYPDTWVFWVHAGSVARLEQDYRYIGKAFCLPGWDEKETDIFKVVHDWLCDEANGKWVMILDNADDLGVFTAAPPHRTTLPGDNPQEGTTLPQIRSFLPKSSTGSILITSKAKNVAFGLTGNANHCLELTEMSEGEALLLLKKKLSGTHNEDDLLLLVKTLDYVPLAISQAAASINQRAPRETVASYIDRAKRQDVAELLEESMYESHRDAERSNSVVTTWQISFQYVLQKRPSAARLLSLISLFDRQWIPEAFLYGNYGEESSALIPVPIPPMKSLRRRRSYIRALRQRMEKENGRFKAVKTEFEKDWETLNNFSFVKTNADGKSFTMHRLFQLTARRWLERNGKMRKWIGRYMSVIDYYYQELTADNYLLCAPLYPHLQQVVAYQPTNREELATWASLMKKATEYALHMSSMDDAMTMSKTAFDVVKSSLGMENESTLQCAERVCAALCSSGNYNEAESLCREILELRTKLLGPHHASTLGSMKTLGSIWCRQGKEKEGGAMLSRAIELYKVTQSADDLWTLDFLAALPALLERGDFWVAEERIRALYSAGRRVHGSWDPISLILTNQLANVIKLQERFAEAEDLYRQLLAQNELNGSVDQITSTALAGVLATRGRGEEAEHLYRRALKVYTERNRFDEDGALETMAGLASILAKRGVFDEAEELSRRVLEIRKDVLDCYDDPWVAMHTLAVILERRGRLEEALTHYKTAHEGMAKICGDKYVDTRAYLKDYMTLKEKVTAKQISSEQDELQPQCSAEG